MYRGGVSAARRSPSAKPPAFSKRAHDGDSNEVRRSERMNKIRVLINQNFYLFWLLLIGEFRRQAARRDKRRLQCLGASFLSIGTHIIHIFADQDTTLTSVTTAYVLLPVVVVMSALSFWQETRTMVVSSRDGRRRASRRACRPSNPTRRSRKIAR